MIDKIKRLTLRALVSDEVLMKGLVLKGGNALSIAYNIKDRGSVDIDFSIENDFSEEEITRIENQLDNLLNSEFVKEDMLVFDIKFKEKPKQQKVKEWKGYEILFKIIPRELFVEGSDQKNRMNAISIKSDHSKSFSVDISSYEYVASSKMADVEGTILRVYTPEMIVIEKLRALCQSLPEYQKIVPTAKLKGRARDFYDIWNVCQHFSLDFKAEKNKQLMEDIFASKLVPVSFLSLVPKYKDLQSKDWVNVIDTVEENLKEFEFYYNFTMSIVKNLIG